MHSITMVKSIPAKQSFQVSLIFFHNTCFICCTCLKLNFLKMRFEMRLLFLKKWELYRKLGKTIFGTKYKKYLKLCCLNIFLCLRLFGPFSKRYFCLFVLVFVTIINIQVFYNESTLKKSKAEIIPEINLLGNHILLTKNHDAFSNTTHQCTPGLEATTLRMDLYFLICITDCLRDAWHIEGI